MKILVVTDKLYPDECGGSCVVAYETINEWQKNNLVDIFTIKATATTDDTLFKGNVYRFLNKKNIFSSAIELSKVLKKNIYDIVVFHSSISWYIYKLSKVFYNNNIKTVVVFHGPWNKEAIYKYQGRNQKIRAMILPKLMFAIEKKFVDGNQNFIFLSEYMKRELEEINSNIENKNITIIPGGINTNKYSRKYEKMKAKELLGIDKNKSVIFILRRLDKRMGIDDAIEAFSKIPDNLREGYEIIVGGKGNYLQTLEEKAKKLNVKVRFEGFIPDDKVNLYFCATDLFLVPSKDLEGFGLVNLESLAMGVPVLARPQGGMLELENKFKNFYLAESMDIEDLKKKIIELCGNVKNTVIEEENIKYYDWKFISDKYIEKFEEILKYEGKSN